MIYNQGQTTRTIGELLARHKEGFGLERAFYTSPEIFELDIERIYMRNWIYVGHTSRIPGNGDYYLYNIAGESIIIIRDREGTINAFFNVCRHRGSRICLEESGRVGNLVCPYHSWVYRTNGELLAARRMPDDFRNEEYGLRRCHVRVSEGLVFICMAEEAPELDSVWRDVEAFLAPHGLANTKTCHRVNHPVKANWKVVAENFWECYHCPGTHPEFCSVMTYPEAAETERGRERQDTFVAEWEASTSKLGHMIGYIKPVNGAIHRCQRVPIRPGFVTQSQDGRPVAPLLGTFKQYDGGVTGIQMYPILWFSICNDHAMMSRFTPITHDLTEVEYTWLVHEDAVEGEDFNVDSVIWMWNKTGDQDRIICENNQKGINSRFYVPGRYSKAEVDVNRFVIWYLRQLS